MITVTEVKPGNVHTSVDKALKSRNIPTGGTEGTDDLGFTVGHITRSLDAVKGNVRAAELRA
jgi:hypothetical protein